MAGTRQGATRPGLARQGLRPQDGHGQAVIAKVLVRHGLHLGRRDLTQALDQARTMVGGRPRVQATPNSRAWLKTESSL